MTFAQMLFYTEQMQTQQRVENGIREIVLGYYGHEQEDLGPDQTLSEVVEEFAMLDGPMIETTIEELPDDLRSILLAENHRLKTGETRKASEFGIIKE